MQIYNDDCFGQKVLVVSESLHLRQLLLVNCSSTDAFLLW